jgi:GH24 family phage-related lysozyme (muramidase)
MSQLQLLKKEIKIILTEMIYKNHVGIAEWMQFYDIATPDDKSRVEKMLNSTNKISAWREVLRVLKKRNIKTESWKSALAGGVLGLSTLTGMGATPTVPPTPIIHQTDSTSIVDTLKTYENSINNPKGGYNKELKKWYPHKSIEGGTDTIAYGHKLLKGEDFSKGLTDEEATQLLKKDVAVKETLAKKLIPSYNKFPQYVKDGIINAMYRGDMGPKTIKLINDNQWDNVSTEYLDHTNYKSGNFPQIKKRMKDNADVFDKYAFQLKF